MPGRGLQESHLCAVVSRTGRACGGRRPAHFCWANKKAQTSEGEVAAPVLPEPSSASASPGFSVLKLFGKRGAAAQEAFLGSGGGPGDPAEGSPCKVCPGHTQACPTTQDQEGDRQSGARA